MLRWPNGYAAAVSRGSSSSLLKLTSSKARVYCFAFGFALKLIGNRFGARFDKWLDGRHFGTALKTWSHVYGNLLAGNSLVELRKSFWRFLLDWSAKNDSQFIDLPMNPLRLEN